MSTSAREPADRPELTTPAQVSAGDPNMQWFASQGILLKNYFAGKPSWDPPLPVRAGHC